MNPAENIAHSVETETTQSIPVSQPPAKPTAALAPLSPPPQPRKSKPRKSPTSPASTPPTSPSLSPKSPQIPASKVVEAPLSPRSRAETRAINIPARARPPPPDLSFPINQTSPSAPRAATSPPPSNPTAWSKKPTNPLNFQGSSAPVNSAVLELPVPPPMPIRRITAPPALGTEYRALSEQLSAQMEKIQKRKQEMAAAHRIKVVEKAKQKEKVEPLDENTRKVLEEKQIAEAAKGISDMTM